MARRARRKEIARTDHAWRGEKIADGRGGFQTRPYEDVPGFCKSATTEGIAAHSYALTPGRYVGAEEAEDDGEPFEEKVKRLAAQLREQQAEARRLDKAIVRNLKELGYDA